MKDPSGRDKLDSVFEDHSRFVTALVLIDIVIAVGLLSPKAEAALLAIFCLAGMWWALWNLLRL